MLLLNYFTFSWYICYLKLLPQVSKTELYRKVKCFSFNFYGHNGSLENCTFIEIQAKSVLVVYCSTLVCSFILLWVKCVLPNLFNENILHALYLKNYFASVIVTFFIQWYKTTKLPFVTMYTYLLYVKLTEI